MNRITEKTEELLTHLRVYFSDKTSKRTYADEEPLRSELFTSAQMEQYSKTLAQTHTIETKRSKDHSLKRLAENERILLEVRGLLTESLSANQIITPAGEWLMDNFYLIEEQIRIAKKHFPKGYSEDLPKLTNENSLGIIRVYDIALQIISHSDGRIDMDSLNNFINAYQTISYLQLGELWAIPIMLRLALIENLRRVSARIAIDRIDRNLANYWAGVLIETFEKEPSNLIVKIADMTRSRPSLGSAFVAEMTRQLNGKGPSLALALNWIEQRLSENGGSSSELILSENQKQAADQVSMRNSIGSLRMLSTMDWRDFVENNSVVEKALREDPAGIYSKMDFATRDRYRHVVEHIAKKSHISERDVALIAVSLSKKQLTENNNSTRQKHIGYYLIDKGVPEMQKATNMRKSFFDITNALISKAAFHLYFSSIFLITLTVTGIIYFKLRSYHTNHMMVTVVVLSLICCSQLAITLVNFMCTLIVKPRLLPRMDFSKGIPFEYSTMVVVPVLLTSLQDIDEMVEALEVRFLANRDEHLRFGLLTDFMDASVESLPDDEVMKDQACKLIEELNIKYGSTDQDLFYLFHRPRRWNPVEKIWMGYERKRGKLADLNALLRGNGGDRFSVIIGKIGSLKQVKYVITLDADTQLPHGIGWKLTATMAHPLNQPVFDNKKQRVIEGHGILQPRITVSLPEITASHYTKLHGNEPGIDPYTRATSDVYQDVFAEGSFIGKGIYEVDTFEKVLNKRFPENHILSHDLLEGCYLRSGLLSDVQLYEQYPSTYRSDVKRRIRWIRGDWQIAMWSSPFAPNMNKPWKKNHLSALSRWKIFDNIRRSLVPIALTLFLILGWFFLGNPLFWTLAVSAIITLPVFIMSIVEVFKKPKDLVFTQHIIQFSLNTSEVFIRTIIFLICLPHEAYYSLVSIFQTLWRMLISHKKLLQWNTSAMEERRNSNSVLNAYLFMWIEPLLSIAAFASLLLYSPNSLVIALPILILWIGTPYITWYTSKPITKQVHVLTKDQFIFLSSIARKTWSFFERFVTEEDNWIPPDNFQEHPVAIIAHRTSPTNIGLYLLSNLSALDFGYISIPQFLNRTQQTLNTVVKLEKYKGHLYNWYDTQTLLPMLPKYISTVDSGNLAGHLLTLKQGLITMPEEKLLNPKLFKGIRDTMHAFIENLKLTDGEALKDFKAKLDVTCNIPPDNAENFCIRIEELSALYKPMSEMIKPSEQSPAFWWKQKLEEQINEGLEMVKLLAPWRMLSNMPENINYSFETTNPSLLDITKAIHPTRKESTFSEDSNNKAAKEWLSKLDELLTKSIQLATDWISLSQKLSILCDELADMEWSFLFDKNKNLLTIGYKIEEHICDPSFYDLLASEARLGIFTGIAQSKLPEQSWFALSRLITNPGNAPVLLSWSGSMFEYLMPLLIMPTYRNTLLDETYKTSVKRQIEYGTQHDVPWGNSESGYNTVDTNSNYQYRAFGTPGLGLKRGLGEDLVVAPYAAMLALMIEPEKSCKNLEQMSDDGFEGLYGFYEAIDYTASRLARGQKYAVIRSYMAHHQGMGLLSLAYLLLNQPMQKRFEAEPQFKANLLLLQERIPKLTSYYAHTTSVTNTSITSSSGTEVRVFNTPNTPIPEVQLLSNGRYHVMVTNSGGGYSRWKDIAVTRWREDGVRDNWGHFCYINDLDNGVSWSGSFQPSLKKVKNYEVAFSQSRVDFRGIKNNIEMHTEIVVSPEDDIEMRRLNIINHSITERHIEITSYAEVVLTSAAVDVLQPAFSNLFVQTEINKNKRAIICTRRPRSSHEHAPWMFHLMSTNGVEPEEVSYETDRLAFIGRGNTPNNPAAMEQPGPLKNGEGSVLDPIVAIRYKITLKPGQTISVDLVMGIGETRAVCEELVEKYQDEHHKDRVFELAWTHSQVVLRHINSTESDAQLYNRLAASVIFTNPLLRAEPAIIEKNQRGQSGLWGYSVSGDYPIVLLMIKDLNNLQLVKQLIQAHSYWNLKGLMVDLVIWNEDHGGYRQSLQNQILGLISMEMKDKPGGVFVRDADQVSVEDRILFQTVARVIINDSNGTLEDHLNRKPQVKVPIPYINVVPASEAFKSNVSIPENLQFFNGTGGFNLDGSEYTIILKDSARTPAPWVNVIANPRFGTVISESGQAYTWADNAHEYRISPWSNDSVCDSSGEAVYIRDEETGRFWTPTPLPKTNQSDYIIRHGMGYSVFENCQENIHSEMQVYVDMEHQVKFTVLTLRNDSDRHRRLSVTGYVEWVLGDQRSKTAMHICSEFDAANNAIIARNPYNSEFSDHLVFFQVNDRRKTFTCDRAEFIGRNGSLRNPDAMNRVRLSGKSGAGFDTCAALQVTFELNQGEEKEIIFKLGSGININEVHSILQTSNASEDAVVSLQRVKDYWKHMLHTVQVETPDNATNILANNWLNYQTLASRVWGRSGYYQSGGAFGFRDQLQDVVSLIHSQPQLCRQQILLAASRQFKEGDVQHWWHPPKGRGVRTHCSDDFLWLPYITSRYIQYTEDNNVLDEQIHYIEGRQLNVNEESYYDLPMQSQRVGSLYEHCVKAIQNAFRYGEHGLPLIGTGDWNDGMDNVGRQGKGESIWLGFFLYDILIQFTKIAQQRNDQNFVAECQNEANKLKENIEKTAWDGEWYRRAYFDDGTPLGSATNDECKIDSLSQSWSVISSAADPGRAQTAMNSAYKHLVHEEDGIICLLEPAFDKSSMDPGYIKGYVPGVRENGGQYTHAAVWVGIAFANLKDNKRAWEILNMLNPINHARTQKEVEKYKVEPYVIAADIYSESPYTGHGGWTWYSGSASWMYQLILEFVLGIKLHGTKLFFTPCVPDAWSNYKVHYRYGKTTYHILFTKTVADEKQTIKLDAMPQPNNFLQLADDGVDHNVEVIFNITK
jgi:cyclic beta-1,2-glucan synthetase